MTAVPLKSKGKPTMLALDSIRIDGGTQPRLKISQATILEYGEAMMEGARFPPLDVFFDGTDHWLADGFHRYQVYVRFSESANPEILCARIGVPVGHAPVSIRPGSLRDAILHSVGVNAAHGLKRNNADKRQAVLTMLLNPVVAADDNGNPWSDREIARRCNVSDHLVADVRTEMAPANSRTCVSYERDGQTVTMVTGVAGEIVETELEDESEDYGAPAWRQTDIEDSAGHPDQPLRSGVVPAHVSAAGAISYRLGDLVKCLTLTPVQALASTHWDRAELSATVNRLLPWLTEYKELLDEG